MSQIIHPILWKFTLNLLLIFLIGNVRDLIASTCFSVYFSKSFLKDRYARLACSIIYLWLKSNISSPVRYSYLSNFPNDNADIFAASLKMLHFSFSSFNLFLQFFDLIINCHNQFLYSLYKNLSETQRINRCKTNINN